MKLIKANKAIFSFIIFAICGVAIIFLAIDTSNSDNSIRKQDYPLSSLLENEFLKRISLNSRNYSGLTDVVDLIDKPVNEVKVDPNYDLGEIREIE